MSTITRYWSVTFLLVGILFCWQSTVECQPWTKLDRGLCLGQFVLPQKDLKFDESITILKLDPASYSLKLLSASEHGRYPRTAKEWCDDFHLLAAINASMYQVEDPLKSTGYMRNYGHINNAHFNPVFGAFIVFNPIEVSYPRVQIIDRRLQKNWKALIEKYETVIQNYRMISEGEQKGWPKQQRLYSNAAIGMDKSHNVLLIYSRSPFSTHDFIQILLSLPINIQNAMYLEGGPEATLYINWDEIDRTAERTAGTGFTKYDDNNSALKIPNVIGVVKRN